MSIHNIKQGDVLICRTNTGTVNEFSIFAVVEDIINNNNRVMLHKYTKFGALDTGVKYHTSDIIDNYYDKVTDSEYNLFKNNVHANYLFDDVDRCVVIDSNELEL